MTDRLEENGKEVNRNEAKSILTMLRCGQEVNPPSPPGPVSDQAPTPAPAQPTYRTTARSTSWKWIIHGRMQVLREKADEIVARSNDLRRQLEDMAREHAQVEYAISQLGVLFDIFSDHEKGKDDDAGKSEGRVPKQKAEKF